MCWSFFSLKPLGLQFSQKDTPAQIFSCEICKIFNKTFFDRTRPLATSDILNVLIFSGAEYFWK